VLATEAMGLGGSNGYGNAALVPGCSAAVRGSGAGRTLKARSR
jgi:hypothetical protein